MTLSTRKAWFSAPRWNFSSSRRRNSGVDAHRDRDVERKRAEHEEGQQRRVQEHHRQEHKREKQIDDEGQRRAREKIADVLQFAHPRHRIADPPRLEIGHRQRHQMVKQTRAELDINAVGRVREEISPQNAKNRLEERDRDQADDKHVERAQAAMHQHLVDDDLEEQRRHQGEQLQKERCNQHFAQQMPVFMDRPHEPGDVEAAGDLRQSGPAGHQNQFAIPERKKFGLRHKNGPRRLRRLHQDLVLPALAMTMNPPSRSAAIAGKGVFTSRDQSLRQARALSPRSLAHRSISGAPIFVVPSRCLICSRSAATPWKCRSVTRDSSPGSAGVALDSVLTSVLRGPTSPQACGCASSGCCAGG